MTVKLDPIGVKEIDLRLSVFETHYDMPSSRFLEAFQNGALHETEDFHEWAALIAARDLTRRDRGR
jgi:hypothetical protein